MYITRLNALSLTVFKDILTPKNAYISRKNTELWESILFLMCACDLKLSNLLTSLFEGSFKAQRVCMSCKRLCAAEESASKPLFSPGFAWLETVSLWLPESPCLDQVYSVGV